jgi:hypothetical protein
MARTFVRGSDIASLTLSTSNLSDSAVTTAKIAALNVTDAKLAADSVVTSKILDSAVTTAKINDLAVTAAKLGASAVETAKINDSAVTTAKIADANITAAKMAADSVETAAIKDAQVTTAKLASTAVTPAKADLTATWTFSDLRGTFGADVSAGSHKLTNLANPVADADAATKQYVDGVAQGLDVKASCVAVSKLSNITLSGTQTVDGVALTAGQRILVAAQTNAVDNGIYVVAAGAWSRSVDMAVGSNAAGAFTFIEQGTSFADSGWVCTSDAAVVGTDALNWSQFSGAGQIVAGEGLSKVGNTLNVNVGAGLEIVSDNVQAKIKSDGGLAAFGGTGLQVKLNAGATGVLVPAIDSSAQGLAIKVDDSTVNVDGAGQLRVKGAGITAAQLAADSVETAKILNSAVTTAKIADANVTYAKLASDVTAKIGRFDAYESGALSGSAPYSITLLAAPQTQNAALMVFVNGVLRMKANDYSLAGSTITFDSSVGADGDDFAVYYGVSA